MNVRLLLKTTLAIFLLTLAGAILAEHLRPSAQPTEQSTPELVETETEEVTSENTTIIFVGDMMFDRYIRQKGEELGYERIMEDFLVDFEEADAVVGNLEGPITSNPSMSLGAQYPAPEHFTFTFDPAIASLLQEYNFTAVSLANNHSTNFGESGLSETEAFLEEAGVATFGNPYSAGDKTTLLTINGQVFALVGFNQFLESQTGPTIEAIERTGTEADQVIVYAHWGDEYEPEPNAREVERARSFVDAGADLVIGAHTHVVQTSEVYKGVPIYYSLGNFVFDQYFQDDVRCGLVLTTTFEADGSIEATESTSFLSDDGRTLKQEC